MEHEDLIDCHKCGYTHKEGYNCAAVSASGSNDLLSAAADYIDLLERKIRSLDPYANMMPWDRPKNTDIAGAKGRWLAVKSFAEVKGR